MIDIRVSVAFARSIIFSNARTSRFSYHLGSARASRTNSVAGRSIERANARSRVGERSRRRSTATSRRSRDNNGFDSSRRRPRWSAPGNEVVRGHARPRRPEPLESDRLDGGAADRSSDVAAVAARASPRTRGRKERATRKRKGRSRMRLLAPRTVPALRDARSATQGQRQGIYFHEP